MSIIAGRIVLSPGAHVSASVFVTTASACVNVWVSLFVWVCVVYIIYKLIYKLLDMCVYHLCVCTWCSLEGVCVHVFSPGNRQVPLQSQTAGCSPQSLTPWYPAVEDAPPVVCWSPGLSCQSLYDTVERDKHVWDCEYYLLWVLLVVLQGIKRRVGNSSNSLRTDKKSSCS